MNKTDIIKQIVRMSA